MFVIDHSERTREIFFKLLQLYSGYFFLSYLISLHLTQTGKLKMSLFAPFIQLQTSIVLSSVFALIGLISSFCGIFGKKTELSSFIVAASIALLISDNLHYYVVSYSYVILIMLYRSLAAHDLRYLKALSLIFYFSFFISGLSKLFMDQWLTGETIQYLIERREILGFALISLVPQSSGFYVFLATLVISIEVLSLAALFSEFMYKFAFVSNVFLQFMILIFVNVNYISIAMILCLSYSYVNRKNCLKTVKAT